MQGRGSATPPRECVLRGSRELGPPPLCLPLGPASLKEAEPFCLPQARPCATCLGASSRVTHPRTLGAALPQMGKLRSQHEVAWNTRSQTQGGGEGRLFLPGCPPYGHRTTSPTGPQDNQPLSGQGSPRPRHRQAGPPPLKCSPSGCLSFLGTHPFGRPPAPIAPTWVMSPLPVMFSVACHGDWPRGAQMGRCFQGRLGGCLWTT